MEYLLTGQAAGGIGGVSERRMTHRIIISLCLAALASAAAAQAPTLPPAAVPPTGTPRAVVSRVVDFPSRILGETRRLLVSLPRGYDRSTEAYPVLYLMDGAQQIEMVGTLARALADQGAVMPEIIVVGIANTHRERDMTYDKDASVGGLIPDAGGAPAFVRMIREEIVPLVEKSFRTAPFRILHGHSLGGYVAARTFLNDPRAFDAYIVVSPSLQMEEFRWLDGLERKLGEGDNARTFFQMSVGNEADPGPEDGWKPYDEAWRKFAAALRAAPKPHYAWDARRHPEDNHGSIPIISTYEALRAIFAEFSFDDVHHRDMDTVTLAQCRDYYEKLSRQYGFKVEIPLSTIYAVGQAALRQGPLETAAAFIDEQIRLRPGAPFLYLLKAAERQARQDMAGAMGLIKTARDMATPDERVSIDSIVRQALTPKK